MGPRCRTACRLARASLPRKANHYNHLFPRELNDKLLRDRQGGPESGGSTGSLGRSKDQGVEAISFNGFRF